MLYIKRHQILTPSLSCRKLSVTVNLRRHRTWPKVLRWRAERYHPPMVSSTANHRFHHSMSLSGLSPTVVASCIEKPLLCGFVFKHSTGLFSFFGPLRMSIAHHLRFLAPPTTPACKLDSRYLAPIEVSLTSLHLICCPLRAFYSAFLPVAIRPALDE